MSERAVMRVWSRKQLWRVGALAPLVSEAGLVLFLCWVLWDIWSFLKADCRPMSFWQSPRPSSHPAVGVLGFQIRYHVCWSVCSFCFWPQLWGCHSSYPAFTASTFTSWAISPALHLTLRLIVDKSHFVYALICRQMLNDLPIDAGRVSTFCYGEQSCYEHPCSSSCVSTSCRYWLGNIQ